MSKPKFTRVVGIADNQEDLEALDNLLAPYDAKVADFYSPEFDDLVLSARYRAAKRPLCVFLHGDRTVARHAGSLPPKELIDSLEYVP